MINAEDYLLICSRYIELNPVRAGMIEHPADYQWSSYAANAQAQFDAVLKPHEYYLSLGATKAIRCSAYRDLFRAQIDNHLVSDIRASWQTGTPLGNDRFREQIETVLGCKVGHAHRGRPVSRLLPYRNKPKTLFALHASSIHTIDDLLEPLNESWDVEKT